MSIYVFLCLYKLRYLCLFMLVILQKKNNIKKIDLIKTLKSNIDNIISNMDKIIYDTINESINDYKLCYTDNTELDTLKQDLFNSYTIYEIDRRLIYDKLGAIFVMAEQYDMTNNVIDFIKTQDYNNLFCLYALSVFDEIAFEIIKDKYKYDKEFITARHNEITELTTTQIIELYKASELTAELNEWINDWKESDCKVNEKELKWGLVMKIIKSIDFINY